MSTPIIKWYDATNLTTNEVVAPFNFGTIDAGDLSPVFVFNIWNNRGGASDVSKMEDCTITTRDMSGGLGDSATAPCEVVADNWFHAQVDSLGETDIDQPTSKIGKAFSKPIGTTGSTSFDNASYPITPVTPNTQEILGLNNNGKASDSAGNFVTVSLQAEVPLVASAGRQDFKIRVSYRYV